MFVYEDTPLSRSYFMNERIQHIPHTLIFGKTNRVYHFEMQIFYRRNLKWHIMHISIALFLTIRH